MEKEKNQKKAKNGFANSDIIFKKFKNAPKWFGAFFVSLLQNRWDASEAAIIFHIWVRKNANRV